MVKRVIATQKAIKLIKKLQNEYGELLFYQSFGCCEGSVPLCYAKADFKLGSSDICLEKNELFGFYIHKSQMPYYQNTTLCISTQNQNGNEYSLEYGSGESFQFNYS
ncbi:DUF779 domain-containing protein [Campylobacter sp. MIT 21-1685]|uniref:DUF779 domain-containing protein n=1 Tax=unclassified Campylobacter TaxID=2593542 RepID=UPI00224ADD75|nr:MULTISPECIES: DUF779 domain-containing protein [unclassified Campylobacter]MCX2683164.1 DUF779 domain-containing protein [Campylobacter sp. MIT 21-1684]MCX2751377.1 DUF779 domain-containing protein [Campylobacter sp. MIT 21-1682]MCX2807576.1 DUF779 domain-containing protein [Campylobacter sp. MIT 21-1685]